MLKSPGSGRPAVHRLFRVVLLAGCILSAWPGIAGASATQAGADGPPDAEDGIGMRGTVELTIAAGDTLYALLGNRRLAVTNRASVLQALSDVIDPRLLRPGDKIRLVLEGAEEGNFVRSVHLEIGDGSDQTVDIVDRQPSRPEPVDVDLTVHRIAAIAGPGLRSSLMRRRVPQEVVEDVLTAFEFDPDMPFPPPADASLSVVYETASAAGRPDRSTLKSVVLNDGRKVHRVYRYRIADGDAAFLRDDGKGIAIPDLGRPIAIERVTSPFGWRTHPVFGDRRFHKGVDFGAPAGTAVLAAAEGRIADAGWRGNYGLYVRIDHGGGIETTYAHLSRLAPGVAAGRRIRKGQRIGAVGQTGIATGPHLYFEVLADGRHIDPMNVPEALPVRLTGAPLVQFRRYVRNTSQTAPVAP